MARSLSIVSSLLANACAAGAAHADDVVVPLTTPVLLKAIDADLAVQSDGGGVDAAEHLGACTADTSDPTCLWVFEPSTTRDGAYYIKRYGTDLYLHTYGGSNAQSRATLHSCSPASDYTNCQWYVEASSTRDGGWYLKSAGADLYLHS